VCAPARAHAAGNSTETLQSGGLARTYILHVPAGYDGTRALPVVFQFHGFGSNGKQMDAYTGLAAKADAEGFILVTPDGSGTPLTWNFLGLKSGADDLGFMADLLNSVESTLCVDNSRVYATGHSAGGAMTMALACHMQDRITAIASVSALVRLPGCQTTRPVSVLEFHGTLDTSVPFHGGLVGGLPSPDIEQAAASWAAADGCAAAATTDQLTTHVKREAFDACSAGTSVQLYAVDGGGHTWPGAKADVAYLGETTREISANDIMWTFFTAAPPLPVKPQLPASAGTASGRTPTAEPTAVAGTPTPIAVTRTLPPSNGAPLSTALATELIDAAALKPADLGGDWKVAADATTDNAAAAAADPASADSIARCGRLDGRTLTNSPGDVVSAYLNGSIVAAFSQFTVYATAAGANDCAAQAAASGTVAKGYHALFVHPDAVIETPVAYPPVGDDSTATSLTGDFDSGGTVVSLQIVIVSFRKRNTLAVVGVAYAPKPAPSTDEVSPLVDLVLRRISINQ
jgi:polyhydroxybutyrate depolymerase